MINDSIKPASPELRQQQVPLTFKPAPIDSSRDQEEEEVREETQAAPPPIADWFNAGLLVVAELIGVGIMSLPTAFAELGWCLGVISVLIWALAAWRVALYVLVARIQWPTALSFADLAFHAFGGSAKAKLIIGVLVNFNFFLMQGNYLLVTSQTLQLIFYDYPLCEWEWVVIAIVCVLPLMQVRFLSLGEWLMIVNIVLIICSLLTALITLTVAGQSGGSGNGTAVISEDLTILSFFNAQAFFSFAYSGAFTYCEIISEMKRPKDFSKSITYFSVPCLASLVS